MKTSVSFVVNLTARIVITIFSVVAGFFFVRYAGKTNYGIINIYTTILSFIPSIGLLGFIDSIGVEISREGMSKKLFNKGLYVVLALSFIFVLFMILFKGTIYNVLSLDFGDTIYYLLVAHLLFYTLNAYLEKALEASLNSHVFSFTQIIVVVLRLIAIFGIIFFKLNYFLILAVEFTISLTYVTVYGIYFIKKLKYRFSFHINLGVPDFVWLKRVFKYSLSTYFAGLFFLMSQTLPILITQALYGSDAVTFLSVPLNFISRLYLPVLALASVVSPLFGKEKHVKNGDSTKYFNYALRLLMIIYIPIAILFISQPTQIIGILYGPEILPAGKVLFAFSLFVIFTAFSTFLTTVIQYFGLAKKRLVNILIITIINIIMLVGGLKIWGFDSIPYTMSIAITILTIMDFVLLAKYMRIDFGNIGKNFLSVIISSIPLFLLTEWIGANDHAAFVVAAVLGGLIYIVAIFLYKIITINDIRLLIKSMRSAKTLKEDNADNL